MRKISEVIKCGSVTVLWSVCVDRQVQAYPAVSWSILAYPDISRPTVELCKLGKVNQCDDTRHAAKRQNICPAKVWSKPQAPGLLILFSSVPVFQWIPVSLYPCTRTSQYPGIPAFGIIKAFWVMAVWKSRGRAFGPMLLWQSFKVVTMAMAL